MDYKIQNPEEKIKELKKELKDKGITQDIIAKELGKSQPSINKILNSNDCYLSTYLMIKEIAVR